MNLSFIYKLHFSTTLYMVGVICLIQIIHYPLFSLVGKESFSAYHAKHVQLTSVVIAGPMIVELFTLAILLFMSKNYQTNLLFLSNAFLLLVIWAVTFFISVPQHNILAGGFNEQAWSTLVTTNWIRTVAWITRALILFKML